LNHLNQLLYIAGKTAKELVNVVYGNENINQEDAESLVKIAKDILAYRASPAQRLRMKRYYKRKKRKILMQLKKRYHKYKHRLKKRGGITHRRRKKFTRHHSGGLTKHAKRKMFKAVHNHKYKFHFFKPNKTKKSFMKSTIMSRHLKVRNKLIKKPIEHIFKLPHKNKLDLSFLKPATKSFKSGLSFLKRIHKKSTQHKANKPVSR